MKARKLIHQRQANPASFVRAPLRAFDAMESLDQLRKLLFWNS